MRWFFWGSVRSLALRRTSTTSPQPLQFGLDHADWEMDDLIFVVFMLSAAMMIYGFRRYQDLSREIKARTAAESEARMMARHDSLTRLPIAGTAPSDSVSTVYDKEHVITYLRLLDADAKGAD
jgi:hypothetical protein